MTTISLTERNQSIHTALDAKLVGFIELCIQLDVVQSRAAFEAFVAALKDHALREETHVFPHCLDLDVARNGTVEIVERDHVLLGKRLADIELLLDQIDDAAPETRLNLLARNLGRLARLHSVLEHHTEREGDLLYPAMDAQLDDTLRAEMAKKLGDVA